MAPRAFAAVKAAHGGKGGVVEAGAHAGAQHHPGGEVEGKRGARAQGPQGPAASRERAGGQHRTATAALDGAPDERRREAGDEKAQRQARDHPGEWPAGVRAIGPASTAGR